jgi:clorobiocin biosynthesis protein CloN6
MNQRKGVSKLEADLILLHAPSIYDFRQRRDIYFPFLGTSGDVPITPLYEYFPLGFMTLKKFLADRSYNIKIINISTLLLRYPHTDMNALISAFDSLLIGIDLHWMVHVQGSLALAEQIKKIRKDIPIIFGGISATYYASQLIKYPCVDMVMRGYDTHEPMNCLLEVLKRCKALDTVPNLLWKSREGQLYDNGISHFPAKYGCGIDWDKQRSIPATKQISPILEFLSTQNIGCTYNCGWCGGSRDAFRRIYKQKKTIIRKQPHDIQHEFNSFNKISQIDKYFFYSIGSYNETKRSMDFFINRVRETNFKSVGYEQYHLTPEKVLKQMVKANRRTVIALSPESHDIKIARKAGKGVYTNDEMEHWIEKALGLGIYRIDIWYLIGMPEQDEKSVMGTVDYCRRLLRLFKGKAVNPVICPMIPFLDPGSTFFENPQKHGYHVYYKTVEEHRMAMTRASIINRINYETTRLTRNDLVHVGYKAVRLLMEGKADFGLLPTSWVEKYNHKIDDAIEFIDIVHEADCISDEKERRREIERLGDEILNRNNAVLFNGVANQAFPANREIGGRWFDEIGWEDDVLAAFSNAHEVKISPEIV